MVQCNLIFSREHISLWKSVKKGVPAHYITAVSAFVALFQSLSSNLPLFRCFRLLASVYLLVCLPNAHILMLFVFTSHLSSLFSFPSLSRLSATPTDFALMNGGAIEELFVAVYYCVCMAVGCLRRASLTELIDSSCLSLFRFGLCGYPVASTPTDNRRIT